MEIYVAYDDLNGIQFFSDKPDRVRFDNGMQWTGYPVDEMLTDVRRRILKLEKVKGLSFYSEPLKIRIDIDITIIED